MEASETERDWRLEAEFDVGDTRGVLHRLVGHLRGSSSLAKEVEATAPDDVVITHDGKRLFAYAASEAGLSAARGAVENVLRDDGIDASLRVSHWDDERDAWRQTDPPPTAQEKLSEQAAERDAETIETRTVVATSGKVVRAQFEQTMRAWAERLGLECKIIEHPHLLTTQVAFTVTGPKGKVDEFSRGLIAEGWMFVRTEDTVMLSPL
jgi:hypothetical protein